MLQLSYIPASKLKLVSVIMAAAAVAATRAVRIVGISGSLRKSGGSTNTLSLIQDASTT
jgi:hypothetical protein